GKLSARFNVGGRPTAPTGRATLEAGPVTLEGVPFETLKGALAITPQEFEARSLTLAQGGGSLVFDGRIPIRAESSPTPGGAAEGEGTKSDQLSISGRGLDLSRWAGTVTGLGVEGTATVEGSIRGAITAPVGSLTIRGSRLRGAGADVGEAVIEADFVADAIELKASIPQRGVAVEGRVGLGEGRPVDLRATLSETRVRGAEIFPDAPEDVALVVSGRLEVQGPMARPRELRARATLPALAFEAGGISLTAEGPAVLTLEQGRVRLAPLVLSGNGTQIEMSGEAAPLDGGRLDAGARGTFDLRLLRSILPRLQATGTGEILLEIKGTRDSPDLRGSLRVAAEAIRHPGLPFPLDGVDGRAVFDGSTMRIEALRFMAGGGPIEATGEVQLAPAATGLLPRTVSRGEIHFKGKNVKADLPEGFRSVFDVDLALRLDAEGATLGGRIDLVKGVYNRDFRIESTLVGGRSAGLFDLPQPQGTLADLKLDLTIAAAGEVWLRNDFATIEGQGELKVGGTVARPRVAGRITAVEGGTLRFRKVRYRVGNGTVDFADPERVAPRFDLQAETTVAEYQVTLHVEGTLDDFRYELTSSPPLPQQEIVGLLLTGHTLGTLTGAVGPEGQVLAEETATAYLSGRLSEELTQRLSGRSGLDLISINPLQVNAQGDPTMRVTIGKQVTPDLYVTYSNSLGSSQGSIYQLDYSLGRDFKLTSLRDRDGSIGGDVKFIRRGRPPSLPALEGPATSTIKRSALGAVRLEGHLHFRESKVRRQLRLREGRPLDRAAVNDGVERLLALYRDHGFLMAEVEAREVPEEDGGRVGLQVSVTPGQRIDIRLEGTRNREGLRQKVAPYWQKGIFLEDIVDAASGRLKTYFRDRGYLSAEVTSEVRRNDDEVFRVLFSVRRGPRVRADEVRITGARQIPEKQVRKILHTAPDTLFSRGIVRSARLRDDAAAVRALYLSRGFPEVVVPMPEVVLDDSGRRAAVVLHVDEGPHVTLRRLVFEGNRSLSTDNLETIAALPPGSPYTTETVEAASARLRRAYDDAGFPDARLDHRLQPGETRESERRDDLVFQVQEGRFQTIAAVEINGNLITRDDVIRKALAVTPDHSLSRADLLSSQTRLYQRGIFSSVEVETAPGGGERAEGAEPRVVKVAVREAAPLNQVFGIGYDSEEKARGQYEIANRNILGSGRYLGLQTRASNLQEHVSLLYREPGVLGGNYEALASAFWEDEERPAFDVRTVGLSLQASRRFTRATRTLYRYSLKDVDLSNAAAIFEGSTLRLSSLSASAVHDTRDAPFDPLRGHYLSGEVQYFGRSIGSEAEFAKLYGQVYYFREVLPKTVWAQAVRAGAAIPLGRSKADPTLTGDALSGVPPSERYFAGGDTTVRGFARDRLGPLDASGDPIGGEGLFLLNEELRFPIFRILQGVVFYDAGNVFRTLADYDPTDLRQVLGAGLRLATPIGPFRFEYGSLLNRRDGEPGHKFFISIGQAF
ncbi:MAG TPA: outer membrane protein assembly factor BamA, partial [Candidatus Polarisedimenticolia bacterium]|nr:outer membrane protein assembly factor BamA [Candidatus Polarisedimenticolia bacterium]